MTGCGLQVREAVAGDQAAWDLYVNGHPEATAYHSWAWRGIIDAEFSGCTHYLVAETPDGKVSGILPLGRVKSRLFGDFFVSLPGLNHGGVLADGELAEQALLEAGCQLAAGCGASHLELRESRPRVGSWPVRTDKVAMRLQLAESTEAQWKALGSKLRAQIRRPGREGVTVTRGGAELLPDFYRVFSRNMRDLGTPVYARSLFERVCALAAPQSDVLVAHAAGEPVAAGLLIHWRDTTEIPWASSLREWNRYGVNMALYWEALSCAIERGSTTFDFGRSTRDAGTYRFKAQWGAIPSQLYWHYWLRKGGEAPRLNPDNPRYRLAISAWQRLPVWLANQIGPLLVSRLP